MLDELSKLSGTTHRAYTDGKNVTRDVERMINQNEGTITYTNSLKEEPVIKFNDMYFIAPRNSMVFRIGDSPIWNKNEMILPMSYKLFENTIKVPGKKFTPQTLPTLSSAMEFDIRKNQPNFYKMLNKRIAQARAIDIVRNTYKDQYEYTEDEMEKLDPNILADALMEGVNSKLEQDAQEKYDSTEDMYENEGEKLSENGEENKALLDVRHQYEAEMDLHNQKIFAGRKISKGDLVPMGGTVSRGMADVLAKAYQDCISGFKDDGRFTVSKDGSLMMNSDNKLLVVNTVNMDDEIKEKIQKEKGIGIEENNTMPYRVEDAFIRFLASLDSWNNLADGEFEKKASHYFDLLMK